MITFDAFSSDEDIDDVSIVADVNEFLDHIGDGLVAEQSRLNSPIVHFDPKGVELQADVESPDDVVEGANLRRASRGEVYGACDRKWKGEGGARWG